jgi:hypothetical protein
MQREFKPPHSPVYADCWFEADNVVRFMLLSHVVRELFPCPEDVWHRLLTYAQCFDGFFSRPFSFPIHRRLIFASCPTLMEHLRENATKFYLPFDCGQGVEDVIEWIYTKEISHRVTQHGRGRFQTKHEVAKLQTAANLKQAQVRKLLSEAVNYCEL